MTKLWVAQDIYDTLVHVFLPSSLWLTLHLLQQPDRHLPPVAHADGPHCQLLNVLLFLDLLHNCVGFSIQDCIPLGMISYLDLSVNNLLRTILDEDGGAIQPLPLSHVEGREHAQQRGANYINLLVLIRLVMEEL